MRGRSGEFEGTVARPQAGKGARFVLCNGRAMSSGHIQLRFRAREITARNFGSKFTNDVISVRGSVQYGQRTAESTGCSERAPPFLYLSRRGCRPWLGFDSCLSRHGPSRAPKHWRLYRQPKSTTRMSAHRIISLLSGLCAGLCLCLGRPAIPLSRRPQERCRTDGRRAVTAGAPTRLKETVMAGRSDPAYGPTRHGPSAHLQGVRDPHRARASPANRSLPNSVTYPATGRGCRQPLR